MRIYVFTYMRIYIYMRVYIYAYTLTHTKWPPVVVDGVMCPAGSVRVSVRVSVFVSVCVTFCVYVCVCVVYVYAYICIRKKRNTCNTTVESTSRSQSNIP